MQLLHFAISHARPDSLSKSERNASFWSKKGAKGEIKGKDLQSGIISHNHQRPLNTLHGGPQPLQEEGMGMDSGQCRLPLHTHTYTRKHCMRGVRAGMCTGSDLGVCNTRPLPPGGPLTYCRALWCGGDYTCLPCVSGGLKHQLQCVTLVLSFYLSFFLSFFLSLSLFFLTQSQVNSVL